MDIALSELKNRNSVISLGGGAFLTNEIRKNSKKYSITFWLDVPLDELTRRLKKNNKRPLIFLKKNSNEEIKKIYFKRKKIYNKADYRIRCKSLKSKEIVDKILNLYEKSGN
jgi:shikimate kinase